MTGRLQTTSGRGSSNLKLLASGAKRRARQSELVWRYGSNWRAVAAYRRHRTAPTPLGTRLVADLRRHGHASTSVAEFAGGRPILEELTAEADRLRRDGPSGRPANDEPEDARTVKEFTVSLAGRRPVLESSSVLVRAALHPTVLEVADEYLRMQARLRYANLWLTVPSTSGPSQSQLWHRDRDDIHRVVKMFVYLSDVDETTGALSYVSGSHRRPRPQPAVSHQDGNTARVTDAAMAAVAPTDRWATLGGPRGTVVLVDTHGFHKGGYVTRGERVVYTCMFTSPWADGWAAERLMTVLDDGGEERHRAVRPAGSDRMRGRESSADA